MTKTTLTRYNSKDIQANIVLLQHINEQWREHAVYAPTCL